MGGRFLITGCARSGTLYMSRALTAAGVLTTHERVFNIPAHGQQAIDWECGEVSWEAAPLTAQIAESWPDAVILHQVRDPLNTIASLLAYPLFAEGSHAAAWAHYIYEHCNEVGAPDSEIGKCAAYWLHWNRLAEERAVMTYRVEALDAQLFAHLLQVIGYEGNVEAALEVPANVNHRNTTAPVGWDDVPEPLRSECMGQAIRYGYEVRL